MILLALLRAGAVTLAAAPVLWALRRAPAKVRHAAFAAALAASAVAPFAVGLVPTRVAALAPALSAPVLSTPAFPILGPVPQASPPSVATPQEPAPAPLPPVRIPEGLILLPALLPLGRLFLGWQTARRWARRALPGPDGALLSAQTPVPLTFFDGLAHRILLPVAAADWTDERRRIVMLHEQAHVERGDWWSQTAARVVVALQWMNPLAWWMLRGLRDAAEEAADQAALQRGVPPQTYAHELLALCLAGPRPLGSLSMTPPSNIGRRVVAVLNGPRSAPRWATALAALVPLALVVPAAALGQPEGTFQTTEVRREATAPQFGGPQNDWSAEIPGVGKAHLEYVVGWFKGVPRAWKPNGEPISLEGLPIAPVPPSPDYVQNPKTKQWVKSGRLVSGERMFVVRFEDPTGVMEAGTQSATSHQGPRYAVFGRGSWTTNPGKPGVRYTAGFKGYPKGFTEISGRTVYLDAIGFAVGPVGSKSIFKYDEKDGATMEVLPASIPDFQQDGFSLQGAKKLELIVKMKKVGDVLKRPWLVGVATGKDGQVDTQSPTLEYEGPKSFAAPFYRYPFPRPRAAYRSIEILAGATASTEFRDVALMPKGLKP